MDITDLIHFLEVGSNGAIIIMGYILWKIDRRLFAVEIHLFKEKKGKQA